MCTLIEFDLANMLACLMLRVIRVQLLSARQRADVSLMLTTDAVPRTELYSLVKTLV